MAKARQLSVSQQVIFIFGLICAILVAIGILLFFSLRTIDHRFHEQESHALHEVALIDDAAQDAALMQVNVLQRVELSNAEGIKPLDQAIRNFEETNTKELADYQKFVDTDKENQLYPEVVQAQKMYQEQTEALLRIDSGNPDTEAARLASSKQARAFDDYRKATEALIDFAERDAEETSLTTTRFISQVRLIGDTLIGMAMLVTIMAGIALVGVIRRLNDDNVVLQTEVAERKRAEETLRQSEEKFRELAENITDVFWMTSPDLQKIFYVSPAYELVWGRSAESLYAHPQEWTEAILPEERERVFALLSSLATGAPSVNVEYQIARPNGEVRWIHSRGFPVRDAAGNVVRLTGIVTDITERKWIEARMFQSQKMETVGKLAGGVAHEFNSILTAIIGQSELLLADLPANDPLGKNAREIRQAAERAATLTRQLLAYGRKQILQPEILDLNRVLTGMVSTLQHLMGREVEVRIVPAVGLKTVKIDPGQMEQVIVNIAMNAADAMPNGGQFTLETANVTLDEEYVRPFPGLKPGGYVMLAMTDTGIGMSAEVKARAFEPFFSTKGVGQGTGLGLATCYGILKQSDGHINVYSEVARGSTFKIYLPQVDKRTTTSLPHLKSPDLPRGTETILLAEDDPSLLEMSTTLLRRLGYTVLTAVNGIEALSVKQQRDIGHIDLLFTDVVMPHMSGKELSDRIRAIYPHTRILFTSAYTESAIVHQGILDEGVTLLQKPFTPSALAHKIREVLDRSSPP